MCKLIAQTGHALDLPRRRLTFGESPECDVPMVAGLGLLPIHFAVEPSADGYRVSDLSNGQTLLDGAPAGTSVLRNGSVITAGALQLRFEAAAVPLPTAPAVPLPAQSTAPTAAMPGPSALPAGARLVPPMVPPSGSFPVPSALPAPAPAAVVAAMSPESTAPGSTSPTPATSPSSPPKRLLKWRRPQRFRNLTRPLVGAASLAIVGATAAVVTAPDSRAWFRRGWARLEQWVRPTARENPAAQPAAPATAATSTDPAADAPPVRAITPQAGHNDIVRRLLTERTNTLFYADLRQLVPYYNTTAAARNLPPQREMTEAFRKHYGIFLDVFDQLTCLRGPGKDEFLFVLTSPERVDVSAVLGIPENRVVDSSARPARSTRGHRVQTIKTAGRTLGVTQFDPFTVVLGHPQWIDRTLNGNNGPSIREAACMFPESAHRNPGALIIVERIHRKDGEEGTRHVFETAVTNLYFREKGESRLILTRNPETRQETFVEHSSAALKEQELAIRQALKLTAATLRTAPDKPEASTPEDRGETVTVNEASIRIPDGEVILREAIDSVARSFMSKSPSVELILAAQKSVLNFNRARLARVPEALAATSIAEALELLQAGMRAGDVTYAIERMEPAQSDEVAHLLAFEDKMGLVFRPNPDALGGTMLDLAVKARNYRNAELLIALWKEGALTAPENSDAAQAVRRVLTWAAAEGQRQRISVGLPSLTDDELSGALALLGMTNGQLAWRSGEEGYRTWLRRVNPDPRSDAKRIAGAYNQALQAGAIKAEAIQELSDAVRLVNSGVRGSSTGQNTVFHAGNLTSSELRAASLFLRLENGRMRVLDAE